MGASTRSQWPPCVQDRYTFHRRTSAPYSEPLDSVKMPDCAWWNCWLLMLVEVVSVAAPCPRMCETVIHFECATPPGVREMQAEWQE